MSTPPGRQIQLEREGLFTRLVGAFLQRDFGSIDDAVRPDVITEMPGSSWLAGTQRGHEALRQQVEALRQVLRPAEEPITYVHEGDQMTVRHETQLMGPQHQVEMTVLIKLRFDDQGRIASSVLEPEDVGLFDHVVNSAWPRLRVH
jgi:ketosteroid isomerase-like protein